MIKIADAHSDFASYFVLGSMGDKLYNHGDVESMLAGGIGLQVFAVWIPQDYESKMIACRKVIEEFNRFCGLLSYKIKLCKNASDMEAGHMNAVISIESGDSIECDPENIETIYNMGARMLSLTWNDENGFASGALSCGGIKQNGIKALKMMNNLKMSLDISHINEQGFWEAMDLYEHEPCASHSCTYSLAANPRNLNDEQIKHIIKRRGFIGINFFAEFLKGKCAKISDILNHIEHVLMLGGEEFVGFGSDFFGMQYPPQDLETTADFQKLPQAMKKRGYGDKLINKICYGNFERYILKFL